MSDDAKASDMASVESDVSSSKRINYRMASSQAFDEDIKEESTVPHDLNNCLVLREVTEENIEIGRGAYGRVFKVSVKKKLCAAKEVHPALIPSIDDTQHERIRTMFYRECDCHSQLDHPNVVKMIGLYPNQSPLPWLVMELMDTNLTKCLEDNTCDKVSPETKASIIIDVSEGLKYLHSMDIVHRDLSSNNILLTKYVTAEVTAKIADFGVAKVMSSNRSKLSAQTMNHGTEHFMPPEAFSDHAHCGKPVDVFSLACVILHIMSHQWPKPKHATEYVDDELIALTEDKRREDYLKCCNPPPLQKLAALCLHNKPTERPEVSELLHKLKDILLQPPIPIASNHTTQGSTVPSYDHKRTRAAFSLSMRPVMQKIGSLCNSRLKVLGENDSSESNMLGENDSSESNVLGENDSSESNVLGENDSSESNVLGENNSSEPSEEDSEFSEEEQKEEPPQGKKYLIAKELSTTEQTFVQGLKLLKDFGQEILTTDKTRKKPLLPEETLNKILFKVDKLHAFHEDFSNRLAERVNNWNSFPRIGDVMAGSSDYIKARPECNQIHFTIRGHLLEIMQRIPSCKRLLEEYLRGLPDCDDRSNCEASLELIWEAEAIARKSIQDVDKFGKLLEVQKKLEGYRGDSLVAPHRQFLYEKELFGFTRQAAYHCKCMFFLFSDILLYTEPLSNLNKATTMYKMVRRIPLNGIEVSDYTAVKHGIRIKSVSKTLFRLGAKNEEEKAQWMKVLKDAVYVYEADLDRQERYRVMTMSKESRISHGNEGIGCVSPPRINENGVSNCRGCGVRFNLTRRRYHCQACGSIYCNSCTSQSFYLQYLQKTGRVCQECFKHLKGMHSAVGALVAFTAGKESPLPQNKKANKRQDSSLSKEVKAMPHMQDCEVYGYLQVKKNKWKRQWLELTGLVLFGYENKEDDSFKQKIVLPGYYVIHPIPDKQDESQWCIAHLDPKFKTVHFKAESVEIATKWVKAFKAAVLGITQPK
ncbi:FYVE, RhoGEF and PH domain-containing protein 2-like isoform X2 [Dysidea avara]|uniref:FYVE, RhoGEF and PH domain-containing protein 2-like isoform X2 n=1 Tax=Dysidea avara TaxID=196820 RepID=UPI0033189773